MIEHTLPHWPFVIGAYGAAGLALGALSLWTLLRLRAAARRAKGMQE